jgi:chorismate mutase/prephenate dehydratase
LSNYTRFVEVATEAAACPPDQPCKTSLMLAIGHHPGDLGEVLRQFSARRVNLTKLESRPVPEQPFRYRFYLDIEGHASSESVREALLAIEPLARGLSILGTYPQATPAASTWGAPEGAATSAG